MLLEAGFIVLFLAPMGFRPGFGATQPPIRAGIFLLLWEWFRIYFESGIAKIASGDPEWRHFTAMDEYYQNGPLPTWIGWYSSICRTGFTRRRRSGRWRSNLCWCSCCFCRGAGASFAFSS